MTTTELYSGYNQDGKSSSRVLRPPGGGSSNIFGDPEEYRGKPTQSHQPKSSDIFGSGDKQEGGATGPEQTKSATAQQAAPAQRNKRQVTEAPYANSYGASEQNGANDNAAGSQNETDFRCHSVTAYRNAVVQNAEIRQKARERANHFNPITHEGYDHEEAAPPHDGFTPTRRGRGMDRNAAAFNPITGEEYPDPGQKVKPESTEEKNVDKQEDTTTTSESQSDNTAPPTETQAPPTDNQAPPTDTQANPSPSSGFRPSSKVTQPPGGASRPLW